ncbi:MAG: lipopolysaccharide heptosyltransferase II [Candidatus Omnitrophica bacterium]|nr:lipopolysaccharide heptosyltransferase II [Candidatus Omnitrophota bacterium]
MKILQLIPQLEVGGVETGTLDVAQGFIERGHTALVISNGGVLVKRLEQMGGRHIRLPIHRKDPWTLWKMVQKVSEIIEREQVDIIHARSRVPAIVGYWAWRRVARKTPLMQGRERWPTFVTTCHGFYRPHWFSFPASWGRCVIAATDAMARHLIDSFGVTPEQLRLIPRGVNLSQYAFRNIQNDPPRSALTIGVIGRLTPIKGHVVLLRAMAAVVKRVPRVLLLVIGDAPPEKKAYEQELKRWVGQLGLEKQVSFIGRREDIPQVLATLDLLVMPSTYDEGFGRVLIEAGACGVPVIASRIGGTVDVVEDQKTGLLVPPSDPAALSAAVVRLLKDRPAAARMAQEFRRKIEAEFTHARMIERTFRAYEEAAATLRILVMKLGAVGDVALITPSLRALRQRFPKAHLSVVVGRESRELLQRCPYIDSLIVFDRRRDGNFPGLWRLGSSLRKSQVDIVVDFQNNRISHWLGAFSGAPVRIGYDGRRWSRCLTHRVQNPPQPVPAVDHQFHLLKTLGIQNPDRRLELWPSQADHQCVEQVLIEAWVPPKAVLVGMHVGGSQRWQSKRWPAEYYAELIDRLASKKHVRVVLTGAKPDLPLAQQVLKLTRAKPVMAVGRTSLMELAALIGRCNAFLVPDTAPLHMAAALSVPTVALFGSTDPARHAPPSERLTVLKKNLPCSPCYRSSCYRLGKNHMECMRALTVDEVYSALCASFS